LPSGQRLKKKPVAKKNAYAKSFVPTAVSVLNERFEQSRDGNTLATGQRVKTRSLTSGVELTPNFYSPNQRKTHQNHVFAEHLYGVHFVL
jgi:hypothetical protein